MTSSKTRIPSHAAQWLVPTCLLLAQLLGLAALQLRAPAQAPVAALFPPWWNTSRAAAAAARAGAAIIRVGGIPSLLVVASPDRQRPDRQLPARLRAAGAWFLADPIALGCAPLQGRPRDRQAAQHPGQPAGHS